jgi:hypothetical protein
MLFNYASCFPKGALNLELLKQNITNMYSFKLNIFDEIEWHDNWLNTNEAGWAFQDKSYYILKFIKVAQKIQLKIRLIAYQSA